MATNPIGSGKVNLSVTLDEGIASRIGRAVTVEGYPSRNEWCRQVLLERLHEAERRYSRIVSDARQMALPFASMIALCAGVVATGWTAVQPDAPDLRRGPSVVRVVRARREAA